MAIEYVVDLECVPKSTLGYEHWLDLVRRRGRVESLRATGATDETPIDIVRTTPEGGRRQVRIPLGDLARDLSALPPLERHCDGCPARAHLHPFGCYASIAYPLSAEAEEWLLSRLPADLDDTVGSFLTDAIEEFEYDGAPAKDLRAKGLLERKEPVVRRWGKERISSDQMIHMAFLVGDLEATHTAMLALFFSGSDFEVDEDDLDAAMESEAGSSERVKLFARARNVQGEGGVQAFVRALGLAGTLAVGVRLDA